MESSELLMAVVQLQTSVAHLQKTVSQLQSEVTRLRAQRQDDHLVAFRKATNHTAEIAILIRKQARIEERLNGLEILLDKHIQYGVHLKHPGPVDNSMDHSEGIGTGIVFGDGDSACGHSDNSGAGTVGSGMGAPSCDGDSGMTPPSGPSCHRRHSGLLDDSLIGVHGDTGSSSGMRAPPLDPLGSWWRKMVSNQAKNIEILAADEMI